MTDPIIIAIDDQGIWRGRRTWNITMEDEHGRSQVNAHGDTEEEALADARQTFANRRIYTLAEKASLRETNVALRYWASYAQRQLSFTRVTPGFQHSEAYEVRRDGKPTGERLLRRKDTGEYRWSFGIPGVVTEKVPPDLAAQLLANLDKEHDDA